MDTDYSRPRRNLAAHSGDCNIFSSLINDTPECGICTCGYGWSVARSEGHWSQVYSAERSAALEERARPIDEEWWSTNAGELGIWIHCDQCDYQIEPKFGGPGVCLSTWQRGASVAEVYLPNISTRGQLLDLLAALKGESP